MPNTKFINGGPGNIGDYAKQGGDVAGSMTNADLSVSGAGFWADMARQGGEVIEEEEEEPEE